MSSINCFLQVGMIAKNDGKSPGLRDWDAMNRNEDERKPAGVILFYFFFASLAAIPFALPE